MIPTNINLAVCRKGDRIPWSLGRTLQASLQTCSSRKEISPAPPVCRFVELKGGLNQRIPVKILGLDSSSTLMTPFKQSDRAEEIPSRDHTSRAVVLQIFLFLVGKGKSVVYTVMCPAFLNKQTRNFIRKQPVPVRNVC